MKATTEQGTKIKKIRCTIVSLFNQEITIELRIQLNFKGNPETKSNATVITSKDQYLVKGSITFLLSSQ